MALPGPWGDPPAVEHDQDAGVAGSCSDRRPCAISLRGRVDDRGERLGVQAGAAHQRAVDVGQRQQLGGVVGLDAAAVEDPRALGLLAGAVGDERPDERDRLLGLLGGRHPPGPDRPDRLVGDHHVAEPLGLDAGQVLLDLVAELALGVAALALVLGLADAQDRQQPGGERRRDLRAGAPCRSRRSTRGARSGRGSRRGRRAR